MINVISNLLIISKNEQANKPVEIIIALVIAWAAIYIAHLNYKRLVQLKKTELIDDGKNITTENKPASISVDKFTWRAFSIPLIFNGIFLSALTYMVVNNNQIIAAIALWFACLSIYIFLIFRYRFIREKYRAHSYKQVAINEFINDFIGGRTSVIWFISTIIGFVLIIVSDV